MPLQSLQGIRPTIDPFRPAEGRDLSEFRLGLPDADDAQISRPLARPPAGPGAPDFEGVERFPLVHVLAGDTAIAAENGAPLAQVRARHPLVRGENGGIEAIAGLRRQGDQDYLDVGARLSGRTGGAAGLSGSVEVVGSAPLGDGSGAAHGSIKAEVRAIAGDAFVGAAVETSTLPGAPVKLEANAGVSTSIGTLSVHRNWNAGDPRADTSLRLTNGDLRVEAGRDDRAGDTYLRVNLRARF